MQLVVVALVVSGIIVDLNQLLVRAFVTQEGSHLASGLTLTPYVSSYLGDPNQLLMISETMFSLQLAENDTILRATLIRDFSAIPEPTALLLAGSAGLIFLPRRRRSRPMGEKT